MWKGRFLFNLEKLDSIKYWHSISWGQGQRVVRNLIKMRCYHIMQIMGKGMWKLSVNGVKCCKEAVESKSKGKGTYLLRRHPETFKKKE